jgi:predicted metallo-beta-lactamase superfamily hydrolase
MANKNLNNAKKAKNDEFYTQYHDIEKEMSLCESYKYVMSQL